MLLKATCQLRQLDGLVHATQQPLRHPPVATTGEHDAHAAALDGLRVLEMPWQLQPDHPAVMTYPKAPVPYNVELQRLYAAADVAFMQGMIGHHAQAVEMTDLLQSPAPESPTTWLRSPTVLPSYAAP